MHGWLIILVAGAAVTLLAVLPPWSPASPWRAPAQLGSCTIVIVSVPDGRDADVLEDLRRSIDHRYPATSVHVVGTTDVAATLRHLGTGAPCTTAVSPPNILADALDGAGIFAGARVPDLRRMVGMHVSTGTPHWLVVNERADPALIEFLQTWARSRVPTAAGARATLRSGLEGSRGTTC